MIEFIEKPFVKVITGIRRSGKSAVLILLKDELHKRGVATEDIIDINFESFQYSSIENAKDLYQYVKERITSNRRYYATPSNVTISGILNCWSVY